MCAKKTNFLQIKKEILLLFFLLLLFPPLPRIYVSLIFKIQFIIIVIIFFLVLFFSLLKRKILKCSFKYLFVFLFPICWGIVQGIYNGNPFFFIVKDVCYFIVPLLVFILLINSEKWFDKVFFSALFKFGTIVSLVQIFFSLIGLYLNVDRHCFRHVFLMFSTEIISFILILKIIQKPTLFNKRTLIFIIALLLTRGRSNLLFLVLFLVGCFWGNTFKKVSWRRYYVLGINLGFTILWMFPIFFPEILKSFKPSIRWRYTEWSSFLIFIKNISLFNLFTGHGFGSLLPSLKPLNLFIGKKLLFLNKFHNVFLFLLFKLGLIGIVFYSLVVLFLFQKAGDYSNIYGFFSKILFSFLIFILPVIHGGFPMSISNGIILGFFIFLVETKNILELN